ncbi:MAG: SRPBCC family protein [Actinobacteria bacterium]|nr:SRPBCC family protein [Actinomycetota bacterium]
MGDSTEVTVRVAAPPDVVYALIADLPRMGEWSPECYRCRWVGGASEATEGACFKGYNKRGVRRWTTKGTVVTARRGESLAFEVHSVFNLPVARWSYRIEPDSEGGAVLTEEWEERRGGLLKVLGSLVSGVTDRSTHNQAGMQATLERIKAAAERMGAPDAGATT